MQKLVLPVAFAAILIALHAIPQGIWSRRWGQAGVTEEQKAFAARLENIPTSFGDWDSGGNEGQRSRAGGLGLGWQLFANVSKSSFARESRAGFHRLREVHTT